MPKHSKKKKNKQAKKAKSKKNEPNDRGNNYKRKKKIEEEFTEELRKLGYFIKEVDGDGNCLFRSLSDQIEGNENNYKMYREKAVEYMRANKDKFIPFIEDDQTIDEYIDEIEKNKEWGGNLEIYALSMALHVNFYIYTFNRPIYIVKNFDDPNKNILLSYHEGKHYNSIKKIEEQSKEVNNKNGMKNKKDSDNEDDQNDDDDSNSEDNNRLNDVNDLINKVEHLNI